MGCVEPDKDADGGKTRLDLLDDLGEVGLPGSIDRQQVLERIVNT